MTDMVEKVARAIAESRRRVVPGGPPPTESPMPQIQIDGYHKAARAAIRALMEPTEKMRGAIITDTPVGLVLKDWQAMLKAALDD